MLMLLLISTLCQALAATNPKRESFIKGVVMVFVHIILCRLQRARTPLRCMPRHQAPIVFAGASEGASGERAAKEVLNNSRGLGDNARIGSH